MALTTRDDERRLAALIYPVDAGAVVYAQPRRVDLIFLTCDIKRRDTVHVPQIDSRAAMQQHPHIVYSALRASLVERRRHIGCVLRTTRFVTRNGGGSLLVVGAERPGAPVGATARHVR